jgi:hypothetical protein
MAGPGVVRVACLTDLFTVGVTPGQRAGEDITPVRALTPVVWQALKHRRQVRVLPDSHGSDGVAIELIAPVLRRAHVGDIHGALPGYLRHLAHLLQVDGC